MADIEKVEFEFPDEKVETREKKTFRVDDQDNSPAVEAKTDAVEVEVVDDRPEVEKKHTRVGEKPKLPDEEELSDYSDKVKKRIDHLVKSYNSEKRSAEIARREREEALRLAKSVVDENKKLKGSLSQGQQALLDQAKRVVATEVEDAKRKYKAAYESGDSDALVAAQEELTSAKIKLDRVNNFKPALQEKEIEVKHQEPEVQRPAVDQKAQAWQTKNDWFGSDDEMTSFALGYHTKLVKQGVDPSSDEYYEKLNSRMRQVFPDNFESGEEPEEEEIPQKVKKSSNVVAPATRSSSPKKVTLTQTQVNIAKRLGVPLELYARKVAEEMRK